MACGYGYSNHQTGTNMKTTSNQVTLATAIAGLLALSQPAAAETLRLLTWGGYAPENVIAKFEAETGHSVEVTLSNNEEMIAKLRATGGGGFDLAQPSQDRIAGPQAEFGIYKPMDLTKIDASQFIPSMLEATKANTTVDGERLWRAACLGHLGSCPEHRRSRHGQGLHRPVRTRGGRQGILPPASRPTLIGFAFSMGLDPFAAYGDEAAYTEIMEQVEAKLIECKPNVKTYWGGGDELMNLMRSGEVVAAMAWDTGGWKLNERQCGRDLRRPGIGRTGLDRHLRPARQGQRGRCRL